MKDHSLYSFIYNKTKQNVFKYIVLIIIGLVIFDQIISLTNFIYNYSKYYDYGKMLKDTCKLNYIEFETERFQISNNIIKMKINNDNYNNRFYLIILIISIFISLFITYIYAYIFTNCVFNNPYSFIANILKAVGQSNGLNTQLFISIMKQLKDAFTIEENSLILKIIKYVFLIINIICSIYLIIIIPLFLILKFYNNIDISLFSNNPIDNNVEEKYKVFFSFNIILLSIIFILQFIQNNSISYFTRFIFFCLFVLAYFYIFVVSDIYIYITKTNNEKNIFENSENEIIKYISFLRNYRQDIKNNDENLNILNKFFNEIFGLNNILFDKSIFTTSIDIGINDIKNFDINSENYTQILNFNLLKQGGYSSLENKSNILKNLQINSFKSLIFFLMILLLSILLICVIVYSLTYSGISIFDGLFAKYGEDASILYNLAFIPFLLVFIVILIVILTKEYNTYINSYILYKPNSIYRKNISNINDIFNKIVDNDYATIENNSTCKNTVNAIQLVIYSTLFATQPSTNFTNLPPNNNFVNLVFEDKEYINILTKFIYSPKCDENDFIDYTKLKEYNFTFVNDNKFYSKTKCSSINNILLTNLVINTMPTYLYELVIMNNKDIKTLKDAYIEELKKKFKIAIHNILNKKSTFNNIDKNIKYNSNNYEYNNQLSYFNISSYSSDQNIEISENIYNLIDLVANEYINYIELIFNNNISLVQSLCGCNKIPDQTKDKKSYEKYIPFVIETLNYIKNDDSKDYSLNIKKSYIDNFIHITSIFFIKLNKIFSTKIKISDKNLKLTKYIIKNYNEYQEYISEKYKKDKLNILDENNSKIDEKKYDKIEEAKKYIFDIFNNLKEFRDLIKNYTEKDKTNVEKSQKINLLYPIYSDNINKLSDSINNFTITYKDTYTETDYYKQLIYNYKIEFLNNYLKIFNSHNDLFLKIYNNDTSLTIEEIKSKYDNLDNYFKDDEKNHLKIIEEYENKFDVLIMIENDLFKKSTDNYYSDNILLNENVSKKINNNSLEVSNHIYIVLICYIVIILLSLYIR